MSRVSYDLAKRFCVLLEDSGIEIRDPSNFQHRLSDWLDELKNWMKL
jgi:hypothetical protein